MQKLNDDNEQICLLFLFGNGLGCDKLRGMPVTEAELTALRLLLREEPQAELRSFRADVERHFEEIASQMDGLYQRDEKRELEYLSIREQIKRLEQRIA